MADSKLGSGSKNSDASGGSPHKASEAVQTPPPVDPLTLVPAAPKIVPSHNTKSWSDESPTLVPTSSSSDESPTLVPGYSSDESPTLVPGHGPAVSSSDAPTMIGTPPPNRAANPRSGVFDAALQLMPGMVLGGRYEIQKVLGEGGMGAVYKAKDRALDRLVALKIIRQELAGNPDILSRFKQEILLASKITHRNVIRIYDFGEMNGIAFITMEYVEGDDLRKLLIEKGRLSSEEAVDIIEQTLAGLETAHREGVIHRDLKPGNIMRDAQGRVVVMDFGLARVVGGDGMTMSGMMVGTMEYMSPEQAQAKELDMRSDLFTIGIIFYELLTGKMPFHAESAIASLLKRTQERAIPACDIDRNVPKALSNIVSKCLERDPALRYQNAAALMADLHAWQGKGGSRKLSVSGTGLLMNRLRGLSWSRIAIGGGLIVAIMAGVAWFASRSARPGQVVAHAPVSVLVGDFQNNTSDSLFDDTIEPMFNVALEGASFINAFNRGNARQMAGKLNNTQKLDEQTSRLVAADAGVAAVVTGTLDKRGSGYSLTVKAIDAVTGKPLASASVDTATKDELLLQVPKLAAPIRKALGDTTPESVQLAAAQGTFATSNVEAVHHYSIGMEQQFAGKTEDALNSFKKASELDPNFARAYAGMAAAAGNLGQAQAAEKYAKMAIAHVDRMTERERYRVRGQYYIRTENWQKCVEEYSELMKQYPADNIGQNNLALCYGRSLNMPKAMEEAQRAVEIAPKDVMTRMNSALYACYASQFDSCERSAREVLKLNDKYEEGFFAVAYAQLGQNQLTQAAETYQTLAKISPWGTSLAASGLANLALYEGRFRDAVQILEKGVAEDLAAKNPDAAADKLWMLAEANLQRGQRPAAIAAANRALANSQSIKIRFLTARIFVEAGDDAQAKKLAAGLGAELQAAPQAYSNLILGELALKANDPKQAIQLFTEAKQLVDTWIGRFDLGRAYLEAKAYAEADSEFDRCIKRRGEALELFMDDMPTYSLLPAVYYYQGQVREGLKSPAYGDSYRTYLDIRGKSTEDSLLPEVRKRAGK